MQAAGVLGQRTLPDDRHRQEQGVQPGQVEAFPRIFADGDHSQWLPGGDSCQFIQLRTLLFDGPAAGEQKHMRAKRPQRGSQDFGVLQPLGQQQRRAALCQQVAGVLDDEVIAQRVLCQRLAHFAVCCFFSGQRQGEAGKARHHDPRKTLPFGLLFGADLVADRPALHRDDRPVPVRPRRCGCKAVHVPRRHGPQHLLEPGGRDMVALVHDDQPVFPHPQVNLAAANQRLQHCNVHKSRGGVFAAADLPNQAALALAAAAFGLRRQRFINPQKLRKRGLPLVEQRLGVHQNQCIHAALRDQPGRDHRLAEGRCGTEHPVAVRQQSVCRGLLVGAQCAGKGDVQRTAGAGFVLNGIVGSGILQKRAKRFFAAPRQHKKTIYHRRC